jgi:hypothetical protein
VSDDLLKSYLDSYVDTPWEALKYLIAEANYGGRVTDELDRRVLNSYLHRWVNYRAAYCLIVSSLTPAFCMMVGVRGRRWWASNLMAFQSYIS